MPKAPRTPQEIEAFKEKILAQAQDLLSRHGFEGFSMRKLSARLGIAAKTIYNYYTNKDELYLAILTKGFLRLRDLCKQAGDAHIRPLERIEAMTLAFVEFGLTEANAYNLMFTWHVPKYNDYVGSDMEPVALVELQAAMKLVDLFMDAIQDCASPGYVLQEHDTRFLLVCFLTQLHGFIASYNNTLLQYVHENPIDLLPRVRNLMHEEFMRNVEKLQDPQPMAQGTGEKKAV